MFTTVVSLFSMDMVAPTAAVDAGVSAHVGATGSDGPSGAAVGDSAATSEVSEARARVRVVDFISASTGPVKAGE